MVERITIYEVDKMTWRQDEKEDALIAVRIATFCFLG